MLFSSLDKCVWIVDFKIFTQDDQNVLGTQCFENQHRNLLIGRRHIEFAAIG
ncbi:hypothetical protein ACFS07_06235 [Undibacterium arcticum]